MRFLHLFCENFQFLLCIESGWQGGLSGILEIVSDLWIQSLLVTFNRTNLFSYHGTDGIFSILILWRILLGIPIMVESVVADVMDRFGQQQQLSNSSIVHRVEWFSDFLRTLGWRNGFPIQNFNERKISFINMKQSSKGSKGYVKNHNIGSKSLPKCQSPNKFLIAINN